MEGRSGAMERRVTLHQLRVFRSVVEHGSFTRAAEDVCLSQPGVTHQISSLAQAVGHPLFRTVRGRLELSEVGATLYARACDILRLVGMAEEEIDGLIELRSQWLRLVTGLTFGSYVLPPLISSFLRRHPDVRLSLGIGSPATVREQVQRGEADLGIVAGAEGNANLEVEPILEDELLCFAAPELASDLRAPLSLPHLAASQLALRAPGSESRTLLEQVLKAHGLETRPRMEAASCEILKRVVASGQAIGVLFRCALATELERGEVVAIAVEGFPIRTDWCLVGRPDTVPLPATTAFRALLRERHLAGAGRGGRGAPGSG
jgi:DNA-binding transcriptional LysR family regulator